MEFGCGEGADHETHGPVEVGCKAPYEHHDFRHPVPRILLIDDEPCRDRLAAALSTLHDQLMLADGQSVNVDDDALAGLLMAALRAQL